MSSEKMQTEVKKKNNATRTKGSKTNTDETGIIQDSNQVYFYIFLINFKDKNKKSQPDSPIATPPLSPEISNTVCFLNYKFITMYQSLVNIYGT